MAKEKRKQEIAPVAEVAETPAEVAGSPEPLVDVAWGDPVHPAPIVETSPLFSLYAAILASVDWQRDVRRHDTICRHAYATAKVALAVFNEKQKMESSK